MKRIMAFLVAVMLITGLLSGITANAYGFDHNGPHIWGEWQTVYPAGCEYSGEKVRYCTLCGYSEYGTLPPKGHLFTDPWKTIQEPTCTEEGVEYNRCNRRITNAADTYNACDGYEWYRPLPALGHDWSEWYVVVEPQPGKDGYEERKCNRCGITETNPLHVDDEEPGDDVSDVLLDVVKVVKNQPANGVCFTEGEEIEYYVTALNVSGHVLYAVEIRDPLKGSNEDALISSCDELGNKEALDGSFRYTVTAEDVRNGMVENTAYGSWWDAADEERYAQASNTVLTPVNGAGTSFRVKKEVVSEPANGEYYVYDEEIVYEITVSWPEGVDYYDGAELYDDLLGGCRLKPDFTIGGSDGNEERSTYRYRVTSDDVINGSVVNQAYVVYPTGGGNYETVYSNIVEVPTGGSAVTFTKRVVSTPANGEYYTLGEEIVFELEIAWEDGQYRDGATLDDPLLGGILIPDFTFGGSGDMRVVRQYKYTVTPQDVMNGSVVNQAFLTYYDVHEYVEIPSNIVEVPTGGELSPFRFTKYVMNAPYNGEYFTVGETVEYGFTIAWDEGVDYCDGASLEDPLLGGVLHPDFTIGGPAPDGNPVISYYEEYIVTADDVINGSIVNQAFLTYYDAGIRVTIPSNIVEVPTGGEVSPFRLTKEVVSEPANGEYYVYGEEIVYEITVSWPEGVDYYDGAELYDDLLGGCLKPDFTIGGSDGNEERSTYRYRVTSDDVINGSVVNQAYVVYPTGGGNYEAIYSNIVEVPTGGEIFPGRGVETVKEILGTPENGEYYAVGEEVDFGIMVSNYTDHDLSHVIFWDALAPDGIASAEDGYDMEAGESIRTHFYYTVTEEDAEIGFVVNQAYITWVDTVTGGEGYGFSNIVTAPTMAGDPPVPESMARVRKIVTSQPTNGMYYEEGETVWYHVTVTSVGEASVYDAVLSDPYMGDDVFVGDLAPGEEFEISYNHVVTAYDVEQGGVWNGACLDFVDVLGDPGYGWSGEVYVPCGENVPGIELNGEISVVKKEISTPANGLFYVEGETVSYEIIVACENAESFTLHDVEIMDDDFSENAGSLNAGESYTARYDYVVTAADTAMGRHANQAYVVWGDEPGAHDRSEVSNVVTVPCDVEIPEYKGEVIVNKSVLSTPADGIAYRPGEIVTYSIVVSNGTNEPIRNVEVYDELDNLIWTRETYIGYSDCIDSGWGELFTYSHTVTEEDAETGKLLNEAIALVVPDSTQTTQAIHSQIVEVTTAPGTPVPNEIEELTLYKYELSTPQNHMYYQKGEMIRFAVLMSSNTGAVYTDVKGYDILLEDTGYFYGSMATWDGSPAMMYINYEVTDIDVMLGSVSNVAWAEATDAEGIAHVAISNEVVVPVGVPSIPYPPVPGGKGDHCRIYTSAEGEGIESVRTDYCTVHGKAEAEAEALLMQGKTDQAKALWRNAVSAAYKALIREADEELAALLIREQAAFDMRMLVWEEILTESGADKETVDRAVIAKYREHTASLCAEKAYHDQKEIKTVEPDEITAPMVTSCRIDISDDAMGNTVTTTLCVAHRPGQKAIERLSAAMETANDDDRDALREKIFATRANELDAVFAGVLASADSTRTAKIMLYKTILGGELELRGRTLAILYAEDPAAADELLLRAYRTATAELCGLGK